MATAMDKASSDSLAIRFSSDGELSPTLIRPRASLDSVSAPFLAEEAYPRILTALLDINIDDEEHRICLSEENIARVASAASSALFGVGDDVFARFLVVPRVESAISVLLWRVRINSTCAPGQSGIELPSVPVHVLASSLAGLLDNTKLYASNKQGAFPGTSAPHTPLAQKQNLTRVPLDHHHHHLAPPTPLTAHHSDSCLPAPVGRRAPPPRLSFSRPMTPPDSAVVETTPISSTASTLTPTTPTSKRTGLPRVKFRPPPIITRNSSTPSKPISRLTQSAGAVTLTFAAAGLSGCEIEPLKYVPPGTTNPTSNGDDDPECGQAAPNEGQEPDQDRPRMPSPAPVLAPAPEPKKQPSRAPSPNPPVRAPSPTKRVLRKAPPTPKSRPRSLVRSPSPTKHQSMWTPSPAEAHYRNSSPVRLTPPVRPKSMLDRNGSSMENSPVPPKLTDLPRSLSSSPALIPRVIPPAPRTPSPIPPSELDVIRSPSPPGPSLRSPSSNLLRSPGSSMLGGGPSVGLGSPAASVLDKPSTEGPPTPTVRRTISVSGVKFDVIESPTPSRHKSLSAPRSNRSSRSSSPGQNLLPSTPSRKPSPIRESVSPSPNTLRTRANLGASPGSNSLSTIPPLSPFPESDSDAEFGGKGKDSKEDEDVTLTSRTKMGLGLLRAEAPSRASTSTPTRKSPPPINTSPSRNSKRSSYTLGVPMTQLTSAGALHLGATSESEAESLPFPGSQSTLSLPGDISLPELVSPFITPIELSESSSGGEAPWGRRELPTPPQRMGSQGDGVSSTPPLRGPLPTPPQRAPLPVPPQEFLGSVSSLHGSGLHTPPLRGPLPAPPQRPALATIPKPARSESGHRPGSGLAGQTHSRSGSAGRRSGSVGPPSAHSRSGSMGRPAHSRSGSAGLPTHSRSGSEQLKLGGRESEMDLLVPFAITEALSRADVIRLMNKTGSVAGSSSSESPVRTSMSGPPVPVFMTPGSAAPGSGGNKAVRPTSMRSPPSASTSSESSSPSPILSGQMPVNGAETSVDEEEGDEDEYMVRTTDQVGFGAGRARVQSGVGIGGGRAKGGKMSRREGSVKSKVDSGLARSGSAATARPRVDSTRTRTESFTRQRVDTITRARVDSTARPRVDSAVRARVDSGLRRKSGANDSPVSSADATSVSRSPSTASARRAVRTPVGRKASATSMRKSSTSSLRSTTTTTTRTVPTTASTKKTSVSSVSGSGTSTPRSRSISMGRENASGPATPKQATPRPSMSTPRTSMSSGRNVVSPRPSVTIPRATTTSPRSSPRTPVAPPQSRVPPARPVRSSLRPGPRSTTVSTSAPAGVTRFNPAPTELEDQLAPLTAPVASAPSLAATSTSPPRTRATSLDTSPTKSQLGVESPRPRRTTSVTTQPPPLSRSSSTTASLAPPAPPTMVRARASSRTTSSVGHEDGAVPFPIPESASESEGGLKVPETPRNGPKRSLSVSSAARRFVNRARGASPVPSMPTDAISTSSSIDKEKEKAPKSTGRSLSRLAFAALLPRRNPSNNGAAEAKAALAQAKAREVAEAKAKAKAAAEEAKARAKAEAEAKAAEKPKRLVGRFGSMSKKKSATVS